VFWFGVHMDCQCDILYQPLFLKSEVRDQYDSQQTSFSKLKIHVWQSKHLCMCRIRDTVEITVILRLGRFVLGGVMVSGPPIGPSVCGYIAGRGRWIFKDDKIRSTPFFGGKWIHWPYVVKFYWMLKIPAEYDRDITVDKFKNISLQFSASLLSASAVTRQLWWMNQEWLELRWRRTID
jgi:hypothetical protein